MVYTSTPLQNNHQNLCQDNCSYKKSFSLPLCEHDALRLQEIFVTCGIHTIRVKNSSEGRKIIQTILHSLNYFHNIGCISHEHQLPTFVCDIIKHIELEKNKNDFLIDLEEFLTVHPCFDFIWVELSAKILQQYSMHAIVKIFEMYHAQERMPVVLVVYDQE